MKYYINKLLLFLVFSCGTISYAVAQENNADKDKEFSISAQIRPRAEYRNGAYRPLQEGEAPAILVHNRARLTLDYAQSDKLKLRISAQNINIWGQAAQVQVTDPTGGLSVMEAYGDIKLSETFRTKIGRQVISLDDERIFGALDWHPAGRSHDALNFSWRDGRSTELQSYFAFNQNYKDINLNVNNPAEQYFNPNNAQPYQHMEMLYGKFNVLEKSYISLLAVNLGYKRDYAQNNEIVSGKVQNMQTVGANWFGSYGKWKSQLSAYYQMGKNPTGVDKSAYLLSGSVGYQISDPFGFTIGADYLSGDDVNSPTAIDKTNYFDPFFGTNHKFYGFMDYFYVAGPNTPGLLDGYLTLQAKASARTNFTLTGHYFSAAADIYSGSEKLERNLGGEIDLSFNHQIMPMVGLSGGYSTYFHTPALRVLKNTPDARKYQDWLWLSININPKIFSAKF